MRNIAVFFGGKSVEHDVSVITGVITTNCIDKSGDVSIPIYVDRSGVWYTGIKLKDLSSFKDFNTKGLKKVRFLDPDGTLYQVKGNKIKPFCKISSAINCMHGGVGEDGSLSGLLKMQEIPLASPSCSPSGICMDKALTKIFLKGINVNVLPYAIASHPDDVIEIEKKLSYPLIVKPISLGSSIGIKTVKNSQELKDAILYALRYDERAIVEPFISQFEEINCACYKDVSGLVISECERPIKNKEVLDFNDKYVSGDREFPAKIPNELRNKIQKTTSKIYSALDCNGIIRVDYMVVDKKVYVVEINTVPGSLAYYLFSDTITDFSSTLKRLTLISEKQSAKEKTLIRSFPSSVLNIKGTKGAKRL